MWAVKVLKAIILCKQKPQYVTVEAVKENVVIVLGSVKDSSNERLGLAAVDQGEVRRDSTFP